MKYVYEGPVMEFGVCICNNWKGETIAVSPNKAKSNLTFQYKKEHGKSRDAKITLPGQVKECM